MDSASSLELDANRPLEQIEELTHDWQKKFRIGVKTHVAKAGMLLEQHNRKMSLNDSLIILFLHMMLLGTCVPYELVGMHSKDFRQDHIKMPCQISLHVSQIVCIFE